MTGYSHPVPAPHSLSQDKILKLFKQIHERKAKALFGLGGAAVILPILADDAIAQQIPATPVANLQGVQSQRVLEDGTVEVTLEGGRTVIVNPENVTNVAGQTATVDGVAAQELTAAGAQDAAGLLIGAEAGSGVALAGLAVLALVAGGGGGGGGGGIGTGGTDGGSSTFNPFAPITPDTGFTPSLTSKTLSVIDAPLKNALVFYDRDLDGNPDGGNYADGGEYLGLTNDQGALDVSYEPVPGATFIIIPAPIVDAVAQYGWSNAFNAQFDDVVTRDAVTGNLFTQILTASDAGTEADQVVSPVSTLLAAGVSEAKLKDLFDIPADTNLAEFNFFDALSSDDPAIQAAAKKMSAAAVVAASVTKAALSAAGGTNSLDAAEQQAIAAKAVADAVKVLEAVPAGTDIAQVAQAATAVAVAGALGGNAVDTTQMAAKLGEDIGNNVAIGTAVDNALAELPAGNLTASQEAGLKGIADGVGTNATNISNLFDTLDTDGKTAEEIQDTLEEQLDASEDAINAVLAEQVNTILGIDLVKDIQEANEEQIDVIKGNVLQNDKFANGEGLPGSTSILSVNGATIAAPPEGVAESASFVLSTSDWFTTSGRTVSVSSIAEEMNLQYSDFPSARPFSGWKPTRGSAVVSDEITVEAGDTITFDYIFASRDYLPWTDYSFFAVKEQTGNPNTGFEEVLRGAEGARATDPDGPFDVRDVKGDGLYTNAGVWQDREGSYSYTFDQGGTFKIAIGVTDVGDTIVDSKMSVQNIVHADASGSQKSTQPDFSNQMGNVDEVSPGSTIVTGVSQTLITGNYGTLIIDKSGDYLYQLGGPNAEPIAEGDVVTDDFQYTVEVIDEDGNSRFASQSLQIKVTGAEDPEVGEDYIVITQTPDISADTIDSATFSGKVTTGDVSEISIQISGAMAFASVLPENIQLEAQLDESGAETGVFDLTFSADLTGFIDTELDIVATFTPDGGSPLTATATALLDTSADVGAPVELPALSLEGAICTHVISNLDPDANLEITFSDGVNELVFDVAENGTFEFDLSGLSQGKPGLDLGQVLTTSCIIVDASGNQTTFDGPTLFNPTFDITVSDEPNGNISDIFTISVATNVAAEVNGEEMFGFIDIPYQGSNGGDALSYGPLAITNGGFTLTGQSSDFGGADSFDPGELTFDVRVESASGSVVSEAGPTTTGTLSYDPVPDDITLVQTGGPNSFDDPVYDFQISGLEEGSQVTVSLTGPNGTASEPAFSENGSAQVFVYNTLTQGLRAFGNPGDDIGITYQVVDDAGNFLTGGVAETFIPQVINSTSSTGYQTLADAVAAASAGDTLVLGEGTYADDLVIDKPLTLQGQFHGFGPTTTDLASYFEGASSEFPASEFTGTITIASEGVTLDSLIMSNGTGAPLEWDESLLSGTPGALDNFTLSNSIVTGYAADDAPQFNAGSTDAAGSYTGPTVADGWSISGNIIGGITSGNGGSMYLAGLNDADISDNLFFRPGAGHLYLSSLENTNIENNFFYHGLHSGDANFDGLAEYFPDMQGYGEGYGGGYGGGYGYGDTAIDPDVAFFGRNFWLELKGDNDTVVIKGNDGQYNSGGIQLYGEDAGYSFDDILIEENIFRDFVNADPNGVLGGGRAQSGFMGGVLVSVAEGSSADQVRLHDNVFTVAADQLLSVQDNLSMVGLQGFIDGTSIEGNTFNWVASSNSDILTGLSDLGITLPGTPPAVVAVSLAGELPGSNALHGNTFSDAEGITSGQFAIFLEGEPNTANELGTFTGTVIEFSNVYSDWDGAGSFDFFINNLTPEYNLTDLDIATNDTFVASPEDGSPVPFIIGEDLIGNDVFGTAANEVFYTGTGAGDTVFLGMNGGNDAVILDATEAPDTIFDFSFSDANGQEDFIGLGGFNPAELLQGRGTGENAQLIDGGLGASQYVGNDTGMIIFSNNFDNFALDVDEEATILSAVDDLSGLNVGDEIFVLSDMPGPVSALLLVEIGAGGAAVKQELAEIYSSADSYQDFSADNFLNFASLPET